MPQLDITINLVWYLCSVIGVGVLYLHLIYTYIPFFIRYWKFQKLHTISMLLFSLSCYNIFAEFTKNSKYFMVSCEAISSGIIMDRKSSDRNIYVLDVDNYSSTISTYIL